MNIKVNNQYLDFNEPVDIERQVKLFEEAATTVGDFSYSFTIQATTKNRSIFDLFSINQSGKRIYTKIPAIMENSGAPVYFGYIKVERDNEDEIQASFFSGNSNWFNDLDFDLRDFDFSQYNVDWTLAVISSLESATTGVLFPVIDTGSVSERSYVNWHIDELHPFIYVKSAIQTLLNKSGIKLSGDILKDWRYNNLITSNADAATPQDEINNRATNVNKTIAQTINLIPELITFPNTTGIYFPGDLWSTVNHEFTADVRMIIEVEVTASITTGGGNIGSIILYKNGAVITPGDIMSSSGISYAVNAVTPETVNASVTMALNPGDVINFRGSAVIGNYDINSATLKITPSRLQYVFASYLMPDVKAKDFVASVFAIFNPVINYDQYSKTLEVNLFKNIIREPELDISEFVDAKSIEHDYVELMENYGQSNLLLYSESDSDIVEAYNKGSVIPFGAGVILSENETAQASADILQSDFVAAMEGQKNPFKTFLPKLAWRSLSETDISFYAASGAIPATDPGPGLTFSSSILENVGISPGDIIKIYDARPDTPGDDVSSYNGEWMVTSSTSGGGVGSFRVAGLAYTYDARVNIVKLQIDFESNDEQALLLALPSKDVLDFTYVSAMLYFDSSGPSSVSFPATAYFYKPLQGLNIDEYTEGLSFGPVNISNAHQITMIESYWRDFERIVKDPVKLIAAAFFPKSIFDRLFNGPLRIKTKRFNCLFFMNRTVGYQEKSLPCDIEAIKL